MCWVMPPASPAATSVSRIASSSEVLPWSTWPMTVITGGRSTSSSSASSKTTSASASSAACVISIRFSKTSASTSIASSVRVWVSVAISPSSISFLITSGDESWSDSATSLTVEPDCTGTAGSSLRRVARRRQRLEVRLDPLRPAPASATAARRLLRGRRLAIAPRRLRVDHHAAPAASSATARPRRRELPRVGRARSRRPSPPGARRPAARRRRRAGRGVGGACARAVGARGGRGASASARRLGLVGRRSRRRRRARCRPRPRWRQPPSRRSRPSGGSRGPPCWRSPSPSLSRERASLPSSQ